MQKAHILEAQFGILGSYMLEDVQNRSKDIGWDVAEVCQYCLWEEIEMIELHSSTEQVRMIANSMTVQHLAACHALEQCLWGLFEEAGPDVPVPLKNFLPDERSRRYEYMEHVKAGMNMPTVLTWKPGGNIGNLHWIWYTTYLWLCNLVSLFLRALRVIFLNFTQKPWDKQKVWPHFS